jgi:hypothetical protein
MPKAKVKTTENNNSVREFINALHEEQKRKDAFALAEIMKELSGFQPKMWGTAIIGFGTCHFKYESGREGDMPLVGFSPRKGSFSLYLSVKFENRETLLEKFGKHTTSKACIYFKKMADIDVKILKEMITRSLKVKDAGCR